MQLVTHWFINSAGRQSEQFQACGQACWAAAHAHLWVQVPDNIARKCCKAWHLAGILLRQLLTECGLVYLPIIANDQHTLYPLQTQETCKGVAWGAPDIASIMLINCRWCARLPPCPRVYRSAGAHKSQSTANTEDHLSTVVPEPGTLTAETQQHSYIAHLVLGDPF